MCINSSLLYLPALWAFLGEFCKVHGGIRMFLLVLLSACLHKVGIWRHFAPWLPWILNHLVLLNRRKKKRWFQINVSKSTHTATMAINKNSPLGCLLLCQLNLLFKMGWGGGGSGGTDNSLYRETMMLILILTCTLATLIGTKLLISVPSGAIIFQNI